MTVSGSIEETFSTNEVLPTESRNLVCDHCLLMAPIDPVNPSIAELVHPKNYAVQNDESCERVIVVVGEDDTVFNEQNLSFEGEQSVEVGDI